MLALRYEDPAFFTHRWRDDRVSDLRHKRFSPELASNCEGAMHSSALVPPNGSSARSGVFDPFRESDSESDTL